MHVYLGIHFPVFPILVIQTKFYTHNTITHTHTLKTRNEIQKPYTCIYALYQEYMPYTQNCSQSHSNPPTHMQLCRRIWQCTLMMVVMMCTQEAIQKYYTYIVAPQNFKRRINGPLVCSEN